MAQGKKLESTADQGVWIESGKDHGKPVRYKIRTIPIEIDRRLHREVYGHSKVRQIGKQSASTAIERMQDYTILRAAYALVDTENFSIEIGDDGAAKTYSEMLGAKVEVGSEVVLDGKWTDALRKDVLQIVRRRAAWISNKADTLTEAEVEDEEEEGEDF